jgi:radical SAM superfamily enzyme YgiQ (UPF0313 family)/soluble cytochrome b562
MVYPKAPVSFWSFKHALSFVGKKAAFPPLGLMTIAALLPENYQVKLIDMNIAPLSEKDILESDIVFISAMIIQKESFQEIVAMCNRLGKKVAAGGPYPTTSPDQMNGVDFLILNEAELTLPRFIEDYENGNPKKIYTSDVKPDISLIPAPRFDIIEIDKYSTMMLQYSRGCPFNCEFCDIIELFGRVPRVKNPEQFVNELDVVYKTGFRGTVFIVDDNFIGNKREVKKLLPQVIKFQEERGYPFEFNTEASVNLADDEELLGLMVKSGFSMVFLGLETPVEKSLLKMNKAQNVKNDLLTNVIKIQTWGIEVTGGFILGFDDDPEDIFDRQIDFIQKSGVPMAMVGLLTALPKTQLYRRLQAEGRIVQESSGNNTHDLKLNFTPVMDLNKLIEGYKRVIGTIYTPKIYFERCNTMLKNIGKSSRPPAKVAPMVILHNIKGLFSSFIHQLFSPYGLVYLKYIFGALFTRPSLFVLAVSKAVMGHHFFKITDEIVKSDKFKLYLEEKLYSLETRLEKMDDTLVEKPVLKLLSFHKNMIAKIRTNIIKLSKKTDSNLEHSLDAFSANVKTYLNNFVEVVREKARSIDLSVLKGNLEKIKPSIVAKMDKIRKNYHKRGRLVREYFHDTYQKIEEQITILIDIIERKSAIPVGADS